MKYRFGLRPLPEKANVSTGLKSRFGLSPAVRRPISESSFVAHSFAGERSLILEGHVSIIFYPLSNPSTLDQSGVYTATNVIDHSGCDPLGQFQVYYGTLRLTSNSVGWTTVCGWINFSTPFQSADIEAEGFPGDGTNEFSISADGGSSIVVPNNASFGTYRVHGPSSALYLSGLANCCVLRKIILYL
jgi:hypothetical protein